MIEALSDTRVQEMLDVNTGYLHLTYFGNWPEATLKQQCHNGNATKMSTKGHGVLWPFRRHSELLRTT